MSGARITTRLDGSSSFDDNFLSMAIGGILEDFYSGLEEQLEEDIEGAAKAAIDVMRTLSPYRRGSGRGHYRSGFTYRMNPHGREVGAVSAIIWNKNKPTLAHLLEGGHNVVRGGPLRRGGVVVGHAAARPHFGRGRAAAIEYLRSRGW